LVPSDDLRASWSRTIALLEQAMASLQSPDRDGARYVREYLAHNELGLALDVLAQMGDADRAKSEFWATLDAACQEMNLTADLVTPHSGSVATVDRWLERANRYPCPCCGSLVHEEPVEYEICGVCGWEDDLSQLRFPTMGGGANRESLVNAQRRVEDVSSGVSKDPEWRPLDLSVDRIETVVPGTEYGETYADDPTSYYYWRART
jgi:hypothetical protein